METLVIGLVVVIVLLVWASHASDSTWLGYFKGPIETERQDIDAEGEVNSVETPSCTSHAKGSKDRIVALPSKPRSRTGIPG